MLKIKIHFFSALAGSPEARVSTDQGRVPSDSLSRGEILRGRPLQVSRGDHQIPVLPPGQARHSPRTSPCA